MSKLFGHDSVVMGALTKIGDVICLSALWIMFSLPIVTIGASTVALYTTVYQYMRCGNSYLWKIFWGTFKSEFKRATIVWLVVFAVMALLTADIFLFRSLKLAGHPMGNLYWVSLAIWGVALTWAVYLATYIARITGGVRDAFRYGYLLMILHPIRTLGVLLALLGGLVIVLMVPFMVLVAPAVVMLICSFPLEKTFLAHQPAQENEEDTDSCDEIEGCSDDE